MQVKFIEAMHPVTETNKCGGNWGKFMLIRFDTEWEYRSAVDGNGLLSGRGWSPQHIFFIDLQTGEGAMFRPGGFAHGDLNKHQIWVCPLAEPFLEWLYQQDLTDLDALPALVELPDAPFAMAGHRRPGLQAKRIDQ